MDFGTTHIPAMNRRMNKYFFQSLPEVKPEANRWLREHAMDCILWAASQSPQEPSASCQPNPSDVGLTEQDLLEITTVQLSEESSQVPVPGQSSDDVNTSDDDNTSDTENNQDEDDSDSAKSDVDNDDELEIVTLRKHLRTYNPISLKGRQVRLLLEKAEDEKKQVRHASRREKQKQLERRCKTLIEFGVFGEEETAERTS